MSFFPSEPLLATSGWDGKVQLWNINTKSLYREFATYEGRTRLAVSPDGKWLAFQLSPDSIRILDAQTFQEIKTLQGHTGTISGICFSPNSKLIASTANDGTGRGEAIVWDLSSGTALGSYEDLAMEIHCAAFSPNGELCALGLNHGTVVLLDGHTAEFVRRIQGSDVSYLSGIAFSPDGRTLASAGSEICFWDVNTGAEKGHVRPENGSPYDVAFNDTGTLAVVPFSDGGVAVLNAEPTAAQTAASAPFVAKEPEVRYPPEVLASLERRKTQIEAIRRYTKELVDSRRNLAVDDPHTLSTLKNLADAYAEAGRTNEAIRLYSELLASQRNKFGNEHDETMASLNKLAVAYQSADRADAAISLYEELLPVQRRKRGSDHPETLRTMFALANAYYYSDDRTAEAIPLYEEFQAAQQKLPSADNLDLLMSMHNLAYAYFQAGRNDEAIPLFEKALAGRREKLGNEDPETLKAMNNLANAYSRTGRANDAIQLFKEALAGRRSRFGSNHELTRQTRHSLALACENSGQVKEAMSLWLESGTYFYALWAARRADHELMTTLIDKAVAQDIEKVPAGIDRVVVGELRLFAGHPESAEAAIKAGMSGLDAPRPYMQKSLGVALLAQGKKVEATEVFRSALAKFRQDDGSFKLEGATIEENIEEMTAAYFLDLISQDEYVAITKDSKTHACFPWFYVGLRKQLEGDREAAIAAYQRSVDLGDDETAEKTRAVSKWRLIELSKAAAESTK
jgi:tetratricopeptide (TPR) repeat protein